MTKAYKVYNDEVAIPVYQDSQPDILVNIPGLRHQPHAGEFTFSLEGVKRRNVDWSLISQGLGYEGDMPNDLIDDMAALIWRHDIVQILADRIKPV